MIIDNHYNTISKYVYTILAKEIQFKIIESQTVFIVLIVCTSIQFIVLGID